MISMREEDFQREVKVVIVGNGGVGKTSLIRQFCKSQFPEVYKKTIGVDFLEKHIFVKSLQEDVKLMLWDTAGQEEFNSMTRSYYRGAKAAVICFSTIDRRSFESVESWKQKVEEQCGRIPTVLVQNKVDLLDQATVERHESEALAEILGVRFYRICAKQNLYVMQVFEYLAELYLRWDVQATQTPRVIIGRPKQIISLEEESTKPSIGEESCLSNNNVTKQTPTIDSHFYKQNYFARKKWRDLQCYVA